MWTDVFGVIIRVEMTKFGARHDRGIYNDCDPHRFPRQFYSSRQHTMADTGFQGDGEEIVCPVKRGQCRSFRERAEMNRDIRKQRIQNEWAVGLVSNRFQLFLGRWSLDDDLWEVMYEVACHLVNLRIRRSVVPPVPLSRMIERLELYSSGEAW